MLKTGCCSSLLILDSIGANQKNGKETDAGSRPNLPPSHALQRSIHVRLAATYMTHGDRDCGHSKPEFRVSASNRSRPGGMRQVTEGPPAPPRGVQTARSL